MPRVQFGIVEVCPVDAPVQIGRQQSTRQTPGDVYVVWSVSYAIVGRKRGGWLEREEARVGRRGGGRFAQSRFHRI